MNGFGINKTNRTCHERGWGLFLNKSDKCPRVECSDERQVEWLFSDTSDTHTMRHSCTQSCDHSHWMSLLSTSAGAAVEAGLWFGRLWAKPRAQNSGAAWNASRRTVSACSGPGTTPMSWTFPPQLAATGFISKDNKRSYNLLKTNLGNDIIALHYENMSNQRRCYWGMKMILFMLQITVHGDYMWHKVHSWNPQRQGIIVHIATLTKELPLSLLSGRCFCICFTST